VLVTENDYTLRLMNGDIGIIISDGDELRACFMDRDGSIRKISPLRLPAHETAWAMTVHKSQGSEFDNVLLILPERDSPVLTRELVYTGITRARGTIEIWAELGIFSAAVTRRTRRISGLNSMLWDRDF
jgi:exodeoxyribonuclease V alpha subunit